MVLHISVAFMRKIGIQYKFGAESKHMHMPRHKWMRACKLGMNARAYRLIGPESWRFSKSPRAGYYQENSSQPLVRIRLVLLRKFGITTGGI